MENSRSDFSCIAIVSRCVDTGLKLIGGCDLTGLDKVFPKLAILANPSSEPQKRFYQRVLPDWARRNGRPRPKYSTYYS